jgi:Tfp pilus assembly pilus retraction ATPase PilT
MHGESVALRLLGVARGGMSLCELRFGAEVERFLRAMTRRSDGLFLVTGPTGSGKTTTLHAMARLILADGRRIVTIEDPVEYELSGALQLQVNRALKLDFDVLLTRALRHDPDVLLVGEVRDAETAALAVRAALTGHLVLASMHTGTATTAVLRLANLGCAQGELSAALCGVLSQRLLRCATAGRVPVAGVLADPADLSGVWDGAAPSAGATGTAGAAGARAPSRGGPAAGGPATARIIGRGWRMRALGEDVRRVVRAGLVTEAEARRALPPGRWGEP